MVDWNLSPKCLEKAGHFAETDLMSRKAASWVLINQGEKLETIRASSGNPRSRSTPASYCDLQVGPQEGDSRALASLCTPFCPALPPTVENHLSPDLSHVYCVLELH